MTLTRKSSDKEWSDWFGPLIADVRARRQPQEQQWLLYHSAWQGKMTRSFFRSEMFNHYVPAARRSIEKYVTRVASTLVPTPEFFEVYPGDEMSDPAGHQAESVLAYHRFLWSRRIKPYVLVKQLGRNFALYSRAICKASVKVQRNGTDIQIWPHARAVDPFAVYVWPETVTDIDEATVVFEDTMMPWSMYEQNVQLKIADPISQHDLTNPVWPYHWTQRLATQGMVDPSGTSTGKAGQDSTQQGDNSPKPIVRFVSLTEVWLHQSDHWEQFWLVWNVPDGPRVVRHNKKDFIRQPYRMAIARDLPGQHYTTGLMDDEEPLQVLLNDQVNMTMEGQATLFSPPTAIDPDLVTRMSSIIYRPRAKWLVKPDGIKFMEPQDTTKAGYTGIMTTMGWMDDFSGMGPLSSGTPMRNMPRGGIAISSLIQLSMADITDAARILEDMILTPIMADLHNLALEYVPPSQIIRIPGTKDFPQGRSIMKGAMEGSWDFKWVGSLQSQDYMVRAQRLIATMGMVAKIYPIVQEDLTRRGKRINVEAILKRVWRYGLGEMGADSIIEDIPPEEMMQIQAQKALQAITCQIMKGAKAQGTVNAAKGGVPGGGNVSNPGGPLDLQASDNRTLNQGPAAGLGSLTGGG